MQNNNKDPKLLGGDIRLDEKSAFQKKLENFWYHYKWHTIIAAFFLVVFLFMFTQCMTGKTKDAVITYAGPVYFSAETEGEVKDAEVVRKVLQDLLPRDFSGDGEKYVEFVRYRHLSPDELEEERADNDAVLTGSLAYNTQQLQQLRDFMMVSVLNNECCIYLLSPYVYEQFNNFAKLETVLERVPAGAVDDYAVRLGETRWYQNNEAVQEILPADTLICLLASGNIQAEAYQNAMETFRALTK